MIDKVQKIRKEVEKLKSNLMYGACSSQVAMETRCKEESQVCMYSTANYTDEDRRVLCDGCEEECEFNKKEESANDSFEAEVKKLWIEINTGHSYSIVDSYNIFYGLCMDIADWQKEQQNIIEPIGEPQVKESFISKHEDKTCKENVDSLTQESVSEDLDIAIGEYCSNPDNFVTYIDGWPKAQNADDIPLIEKAIRFGANWQKQQMMAKAVDATVHIDAGGYPYIPQMELYDYDKDIPFAKEGDKYKVILIKEK